MQMEQILARRGVSLLSDSARAELEAVTRLFAPEEEDALDNEVANPDQSVAQDQAAISVASPEELAVLSSAPTVNYLGMSFQHVVLPGDTPLSVTPAAEIPPLTPAAIAELDAIYEQQSDVSEESAGQFGQADDSPSTRESVGSVSSSSSGGFSDTVPATDEEIRWAYRSGMRDVLVSAGYSHLRVFRELDEEAGYGQEYREEEQ